MVDETRRGNDRYHTGLGGLLLDRNGDGYVDDLALRIVLPSNDAGLTSDVWRALIDLAARAGLETAGLPDRIVLAPGEDAPPEAVRLFVQPDDPKLTPSGQVIAVWTAAEIDVLTSSAATSNETMPGREASSGITDLSSLFELGGMLVDRDDDLLPDGTRVCLRLPEPCPPAIGVAAIELAARIGMESGGIDLPIGLTADQQAPQGTIVLDLEPHPAGDLPPGHGRLRTDGTKLTVEGDGFGVAELVRFLARTWPRVVVGGGQETEIGRCVDALRDIASAAGPLGRTAALVAEEAEIPAGSTVYLPTADLEELALVTRALSGRDVTIEPDAHRAIASVLDWEAIWEVDRVREVMNLEVRPLLLKAAGSDPVHVLIAVSEPLEVRHELERNLQSFLDHAVPDAERISLRVRSAYKLGLSWLREDVIPALSRIEGIDRVEIRYAPFETTPGDGPPQLDMRIRWLQELYPGDELLAAALGLPLDAIDLVEQVGPSGETYEVVAFAGGEERWRDAISPFSYSLPYIPLDPARGSVHASTGGIRVRSGANTLFDRNVPTDIDHVWHWFQAEALVSVAEYIDAVSHGDPRAEQQPFFDAMEVDVWASEPDEVLGIREELDSSAEALHEDIYFGALDWFAVFGEERAGSPFDGPGSIVPLVHTRYGPPSARVTLKAKRRFTADVITPDHQHIAVGQIADLPVPRFAVTGLTVGGQRVRSIELRGTLPEGTSSDRSQRLLDASSLLLEDRGGASLPVRIELGTGTTIPIPLPIPGSALEGVAPAMEAPALDRIYFEADLPPQLARLASRPGVSVSTSGHSFRGRPMWAIELTAPMPTDRWSAAKLGMQKPTLLIAARHHANEVSSTTAVLRLAELLTTDPEWMRLLDRANVVLIPFENPDGAALHLSLVEEHPTWKHHAARYNAVGFEFTQHLMNDETPYGEARIRPALNRRWRPDVIVDNHGVPSHEWSQHFAGFGSPPRFNQSYWMVQALLYGIINYVDDAEHGAFAEELRDRIARELVRDPELRDLNATYGDRYRRWGSSRVPERFPTDLHDGFLCYMTKSVPNPAGRNLAVRAPRTATLDWVTEVPDETAHGAQLSATARAHLLANRVTLDLMIESAGQPVTVIRQSEGGGLSVVVRRERPLVVPAVASRPTLQG